MLNFSWIFSEDKDLQEELKASMPIYEYVCQKCGHHLEIMQKMSDKPLSKCSNCRGKLEKIFSQTSFQLKGSGWYVNDYAKSGKSGKTETTETKTDKKAETKPETKTETKEAATSASTTSTNGAGAAGKNDQ
jgi:putative FmdB family regulatory protein